MAASTKEGVPDIIAEKKYRKRKKRLYKNIQSQMEFYFSDANLNKDRFLYQLMCETDDGRVDIREFLKFRKIRSLTEDVKDIAQALSSSEILQITEDNRYIVRKTPLQTKGNVDECTIYVEGLPPHADHDWFRETFASFGKLAYISLPRFRTTQKLKGFAFLEFETAEEAQSACKYYNPGNDKFGTKDAASVKEVPETSIDVKNVSEKEPSKKRRKIEATGYPDSSENAPETETSDSKKHRMRKKKNKDKDDVDKMHLRVMPKMEWKRLRNLYLSLQRANMAAVKKSLGMTSNPEIERREIGSAEVIEQDNNSESKVPGFIPGVIIKFETDEPVANAKLFRNEFKETSGVLYIDLKDNQNVGHIRCDEHENAAKLLTELKGKYLTALLLKGEEEACYWKRIVFDRESKVKDKSKSKPVRGKDKVVTKVVQSLQKRNLHIRFDD